MCLWATASVHACASEPECLCVHVPLGMRVCACLQQLNESHNGWSVERCQHVHKRHHMKCDKCMYWFPAGSILQEPTLSPPVMCNAHMTQKK